MTRPVTILVAKSAPSLSPGLDPGRRRISAGQQEKNMKLRSFYIVGALAIALAFMGVTFAQKPEMNIDPARHANLAAAQHHIGEAFEKIQEAQRANKDELGGHAEKALDLLSQADRELKAAAEYKDHHK
jgi:F0F1-type ATP synthase membrane subunit b/b'